jgi:hypothetical protein
MPTTTHSCEQAMYCTHSSVLSIELWASAAAMCCAPSAPMELYARLYAHVCVRRAIQRTCADHDARSHSNNRERGHIHPCIYACRHTKYKHACIPCTYTFIPVHNAIVHTIHKRAPLLRTHTSRIYTALTPVFGVSSCGQVLQQCAALPHRLWSC